MQCKLSDTSNKVHIYSKQQRISEWHSCILKHLSAAFLTFPLPKMRVWESSCLVSWSAGWLGAGVPCRAKDHIYCCVSRPTTQRELRCFLGIVGYCCWFCKHSFVQSFKPFSWSGEPLDNISYCAFVTSATDSTLSQRLITVRCAGHWSSNGLLFKQV